LFTGKITLELKKRIMKLLGLECRICSRHGRCLRQTQEDQKTLKCRYGEEWKRSAGLIKLLMSKFSEE